MSIRALNWAWLVIPRANLKPASTLVLLALAHCHFEDTGKCDPSNAFLRKKTGLSERSVRYGLQELYEKGVISITYRQAKTGRWRRNLNNRYAFKGGAKFAGGVGHGLPPLRDTRGKLPTPFHSLSHDYRDETEDCTDNTSDDRLVEGGDIDV